MIPATTVPELRAQVRKLDALLRGTRVLLAGIVHEVGGEVVIGKKTLEMMDSGDYVMEQKIKDDPVSAHIIVTQKPPPELELDVDPEENNG